MSKFLRQCEDDVLQDVIERRYKELCELGQFLPGVSEAIDVEQPPAWYDGERFKKAQRVANKYYIRSERRLSQ